LVAATVAASVVVAMTIVDDSPSGGPAKAPVTPYPTTGVIALSCRNDMRSLITWEALAPYRRTPLGLARLFTNPVAEEHAVVQSVDDRSARVILLRGNGTAWAKLALAYDPARGWYLGTADSCDGRYVRMYFQHQPQF
jgi:hypothetical protein